MCELEMGKSGMQNASNQVRDFAFATEALWQRAQIRGGLSPCSAVILVEQPRLREGSTRGRRQLGCFSFRARCVKAHRMGMQAAEGWQERSDSQVSRLVSGPLPQTHPPSSSDPVK